AATLQPGQVLDSWKLSLNDLLPPDDEHARNRLGKLWPAFQLLAQALLDPTSQEPLVALDDLRQQLWQLSGVKAPPLPRAQAPAGPRPQTIEVLPISTKVFGDPPFDVI